MTVKELIAALRTASNQDAEVLFHANNHTTRPSDRAVIREGPKGVIVGNFTAESHLERIGLESKQTYQ
tara:strand:- start:326 stop:529 length:204 start_codon:yes stop_codon:yes gene_type:complete